MTVDPIEVYLRHLEVERRLSPHTLAAYGRDLSRLRVFAVRQGRDVAAIDRRALEALVRDAMVDLRAGTRSAPEAELRHLWISSGLPEPLWNPRLLDRSGRLIAVPDAYVPTAGVAVEVDSVEFHLDPAAWRRTLDRHARVSAVGVVSVHTPPSRIRDDGPALMREVASTVDLHDGRVLPGVVVVPR